MNFSFKRERDVAYTHISKRVIFYSYLITKAFTNVGLFPNANAAMSRNCARSGSRNKTSNCRRALIDQKRIKKIKTTM